MVTSLQPYAVGGNIFCNHIYVVAHVFKARQCMQSERRNTAKYGMTQLRKTQILHSFSSCDINVYNILQTFFILVSYPGFLLFYQREDQLPYPQLCPLTWVTAPVRYAILIPIVVCPFMRYAAAPAQHSIFR